MYLANLSIVNPDIKYPGELNNLISIAPVQKNLNKDIFTVNFYNLRCCILDSLAIVF